MARPHSPDRFAVKWLTAEATIGAEWVAVTQETALPSRFAVRASLQIPHCDVTLLAVVGRFRPPIENSTRDAEPRYRLATHDGKKKGS